MNNNTCPECKTENEPEYKYCKNCGAALFTNTTANPVNENTNTNANETSYDLIDGNSIEDVVAFVGKNPQKILPKFIKMEKTGSKADWCWPPFVLGFLFGPIGPAIWFLYRKMYSYAAIFGAINIASSYILKAFKYFLGIGTLPVDPFDSYLDGLKRGVIDYQSLISALTDKRTLLGYFVNSAYSALGIACGVVAGIFGIYFYKRHASKSINRIKATVMDANYRKIALASKGGTSVGAVILGTIIISLVANLPDMIYNILKVMKVVFTL